MKREHVADIRIPRIAAPDAVRIGDHRADALFSRLFVSGDLDVVVEALAHLVNAVGPDNFRRSRGFHLRLDQDVCPVPVVERADDFARKFEMRRLIDSYRYEIGFEEKDIRAHEDRVPEQSVIDVLRMHPDFLLERRKIGQLPDRDDHR